MTPEEIVQHSAAQSRRSDTELRAAGTHDRLFAWVLQIVPTHVLTSLDDSTYAA